MKFTFKAITVIILGSLFIYVVLRASNLSFVHDESLSYGIIKGDEGQKTTANHHLLNTFLMALFSKCFGDSELSLRFPNVLSFLIYLAFCFKLLEGSKKIVFVLFGVPLLFLNPFVLDFFSLARGYGLSLGCMMMSVYFLLRKNPGDYTFNILRKDFIFAALGGSLSIVANLSLLNFYVTLLFLFGVQYLVFVKRNPQPGKNHFQFSLLFIISFVPLFFAVKRLLFLKGNSQLYYGAENLSDIPYSLLERSYYFTSYLGWINESLLITTKWMIPIVILISIPLKLFKGPFAKISFLIVLILLGLWLEHQLFGALYPYGRTGIYFIPLTGLFIYYFIASLIERFESKIKTSVTVLFLLIISFPLCWHFFSSVNLNYCYEWKYDANTKNAVTFLAEKKLPGIPENKKLILESNWIFEPAINYYIQSKNLRIEEFRRNGTPINSGFIYEFEEGFKDSDCIKIVDFKSTGSAIYEKIN